MSDLLVSHGASLTVTNSLNQSCVHIASESGIVQSLVWVVEHTPAGSVLDVLMLQDKHGSSCLHLAAKVSHCRRRFCRR